MSVLKSALDTTSGAYEADKAAMLASVAELEELARTVIAAGGEKAVARHRQRGKLLGTDL